MDRSANMRAIRSKDLRAWEKFEEELKKTPGESADERRPEPLPFCIVGKRTLAGLSRQRLNDRQMFERCHSSITMSPFIGQNLRLRAVPKKGGISRTHLR